MEVLQFREVDGRPGALLIIEDFDRLGMSPADLMTLATLLAPESARRLVIEAIRHPTNRESSSLRIKRGIRAAKERRQKEQ
jgi:DNA invertase Pin-like site-specific DNA recombinase